MVLPLFLSITTLYNANAIPQNGLQLHLDPNNSTSYPGTGNTWYDISGNNRHFSLQNRDFRNSGGIKYFDTWNMKITGPASNSFGINNNSGFTFIVACRPSNTSASGGTHYSKSFCWMTNQGNGRGIFSHIPWSSQYIWLDIAGMGDGSDPSSHRLSGTMSNYFNAWHLFTFRSNAANSSSTALRSIYVDSTSLATTTIPDADLNLNSQGARIAYGEDGGNSEWDARLGAFLVYNRSLSDAELARVYAELKPTYGLP